MQGWEMRPRGDPLVLADELESFSTDQLLAEVTRRLHVLREQTDGPVMCDGCVHQRFWKRRDAPPDDFNPCWQGFGVDFKMPDDDDLHGDTSGFYRPGGCPDRQEPPPPPDPPPPPRGGKPELVRSPRP